VYDHVGRARCMVNLMVVVWGRTIWKSFDAVLSPKLAVTTYCKWEEVIYYFVRNILIGDGVCDLTCGNSRGEWR